MSINNMSGKDQLTSVCAFFSFSDVNDCAEGPCQHNGTCIDLLNDYNCTCAPGYKGKNCSEGILSISISQLILHMQHSITVFQIGGDKEGSKT